MSLLEVRDLQKIFLNRRALRGVTFSMRQGEILALLGPTGAGKTSTLLSIAGLVKPASGTVIINDRDVTAADPRIRDVAVVFEGFNLLPTLSVYDNIAFPLRSPVYRQPEGVVDELVTKAARDLKIAHLLKRDTSQLSGGERQRVAVARALVRKPQIYLLDEPLSALDLKLRESLRAELRALQQRKSATILYATHDYHGAAAIADRIALISEGRILQVDTLDNIIADPADATVGRLIGSPSMAFFKARGDAAGLSIDGYGKGLAAPAGVTASSLLAGYWPEDIEISDAEAAGFQEAEVLATDFRGMDRAIQVRAGGGSFRKVVPLSSSLTEGSRCWFRLPPGKGFFFDAATGARMREGAAP
jgi:multiple sugar transport system ATP-binding protein